MRCVNHVKISCRKKLANRLAKSRGNVTATICCIRGVRVYTRGNKKSASVSDFERTKIRTFNKCNYDT